MNYFFFTSSDDYDCRLTIPKFRVDGRTRPDNKLIRARIIGGSWDFETVDADEENDAFWYLDVASFDADDILFIATPQELRRQRKEKNLINLNDFKDSDPAFRCNLAVSNGEGGWSSYQSEYPYRMAGRRGTIFSNIATLSNPGEKLDGCFLRNIFHQPIVESYRVAVLDTATDKVVMEASASSNRSSYISFDDLPPDRGNLVLWAENFLGIPIYVSSDDRHNISMEHTHPPHESVHGVDRFALVGRMKAKYDEKLSS